MTDRITIMPKASRSASTNSPTVASLRAPCQRPNVPRPCGSACGALANA